jgi:hypothetical protein
MAAISVERKDNNHGRYQREQSKTNSRILLRVTKNQGLGIVEGHTPSETEEETASSVGVRRAGNVGAPATVGRKGERERERQK